MYKMATVGQQLTGPESGWRRYDNVDSRLLFLGDWMNSANASCYGNGLVYTNTLGSSIKFSFVGTKLRIYDKIAPQRSNACKIIIDGLPEYFSANGPDLFQAIVYEKLGLTETRHIVEITFEGSGNMGFDAIDIDETGYLIPQMPTNLIANAGDSQVTLAWTFATGATGYNVKRSTTAGGPYTTIVSGITGTTYLDTDVINGKTYFYVVSAVDQDGSEGENSNEATATPGVDKAIFIVTMVSGERKEYELNRSEVDTFIDWYNSRSAGMGLSYYIINKDFNIGPFTSRKDHLVFDKIQDFEIMEFKK